MNDFNHFKKWIQTGNEVEFSLLGKRYSVTYCEFYQPDTEFQSANDFMKHAKIGENLLADLWDKAEDITIF